MQRLVIITGASRGIGAQIALDLNKRFGENTRYLLIARDQPKLEEVKAQMSKENSNLVHSSTKNKFVVLAMDFSSHFTTKEMFELIKSSLTNNGEQQLDKLDELYVFYNHGTLSLAPVEEIADQMDEQFRTNVTSVWILMAAIREMFPISMVPVQFHINISSLLATKLIESFSAYSATRSARATLFKCLALEHPNLRVLNYQPGPVYTDMQKYIYDTNTCIYDSYRSDYVEGKFLSAEVSVKRLLDIIQANAFQNGSTIDFYDD